MAATKQYFVDGVNGVDSGARNGFSWAASWKTLAYAIANYNATVQGDDGNGCYVNLAAGQTFDNGTYINPKVNAYTVVFRPCTVGSDYSAPGNYVSGATIANAGGGGSAILRQNAQDCSNYRFENLTFSCQAGVNAAQLGASSKYTNYIEFRDCTFTMASNNTVITTSNGTTAQSITSLKLTRPTVTSYMASSNILRLGCSTGTCSDLYVTDGVFTGTGILKFDGPINKLTFTGNTCNAGVVVTIGESGNTRGVRITGVTASNNTVAGHTTDANAHAFTVDADCAVISGNTIATNAGNYGLVLKWGVVYYVSNNAITSTVDGAVICKGVQDCVFVGNTITATGGGANACVSVYVNAEDSNKATRNLLFFGNTFVTSGTSPQCWAILAASVTGIFYVNGNQYTLTGTGASSFYGVAIASDTFANIAAMFSANGYPANETINYPLVTTANTALVSVGGGSLLNLISQADAKYKGTPYFGVAGALVDGQLVIPAATRVQSGTPFGLSQTGTLYPRRKP